MPLHLLHYGQRGQQAETDGRQPCRLVFLSFQLHHKAPNSLSHHNCRY
ncbi:hypothetical protein [Planctellipticum variicoloris]|nr:hypothetical protein SH412_002739 [Planctomycetaceae bacterium SH412]